MNLNEARLGLFSRYSSDNMSLEAIHVSGCLSGLVAQIKVRQVYKNWSDANLECVYTFPMAWQSILLGMRVELNGKNLTGTVKPKKVAEAQYEDAIDSGDLPVMLEKVGKDFYTANIGNIQPGDEVVIELDYAQILKAVDGTIRFNLPTTIAPRYGDAVEAGVRPHQQAASDMLAEHRLFVNLTLGESLSAGTIYSPSHEIRTQQRDGTCDIKLQSAAWLDRDFVLVIEGMQDMRFALAAKDPTRPGEATLMTGSVFRPQKPQSKKALSIKVLVDCSGSMQGDSIAQAQDCLNWLYGQLTNADRVTLSRFGSTVMHDLNELKKCTLAHKLALKAFTRRLQANLGGTEMGQALEGVIGLGANDRAEVKDAVILLITDGDVWEVEQTIATVRASGHRIYAVGVGSAPAESLLREMAEVTGGACELVTPRESMQQAVARLLLQMRKAQTIEQDIQCTASVLWQTQTVRHAAPGESLIAWTQVQSDGPFDVDLSNHPGEAPAPLPVVWETGIELSRIAAAARLNNTAQAEDREAIALAYQLVTNETNLILVHERAEREKAEDLPELHQVRPMLAAAYGGYGTVILDQSHLMQQICSVREQYSVSFTPEISNSRSSMPAVWRFSSSHVTARIDGMASSGLDEIEIPAFLRKDADGGGSVAMPAKKAPMAAPGQSKAPQVSPRELTEILRCSDTLNPVAALIKEFNQAALGHNQFRSALAACLRTNTAQYLQWLVAKHMKAAGSATPIWAVFLTWAATRLSVPLDRHANRLLREFIKTISLELQNDVLADLEAIDQHKEKQET